MYSLPWHLIKHTSAHITTGQSTFGRKLMHRPGWNINVRCSMVFMTLQKITGKYIEITMSFSLFGCNPFLITISCNLLLFFLYFQTFFLSIFLSSRFQQKLWRNTKNRLRYKLRNDIHVCIINHCVSLCSNLFVHMPHSLCSP